MVGKTSVETRPKLGTWIWICFKIGALSFGSVSRVVLYADEIVRDRAWLSEEEFREALTLAQILPGPNLVNLAAALGARLFSYPLAILSLLPLLIPGALIAILFVLFVPFERPWIQELSQGFAIGALYLMGRFLYMLFKGITAQTARQASKGETRVAAVRISRYTLAAIGTALLLNGAPILPFVFAGLAVCIGWEFLSEKVLR